MKLELNEQQKMIRNMVREFAEKEIAPIAAELDKTGEYPTKTLEKMAKLGLLGIIIPQQYGGAGLDTISYVTVVEEISRKCASTGVITSVHNSLAAWPIMKYGTEEQKKKYLPILAKGEKIGAFAGTEPNAGSDLGAMKTSAVLKGNHYVINGDKTFITSGPKAGIIIVFAVTDKTAGAKSWRVPSKASRSVASLRNSGSTPRRPRNCSSRTWKSPKKTSWEKRETGSR